MYACWLKEKKKTNRGGTVLIYHAARRVRTGEIWFTADEVNSDVEIWPGNVETVQCFIGLSTQWKTGINGVTGLDYAAIPVVMEMNEVVDKREVFGGLQAMEAEVLKIMHKLKNA